MKKLIIAGLSVMMLAGCGNKTEQLGKFYEQYTKTSEKEVKVTDISKELNRLDTEKAEYFKKISTAKKGDINLINSNAKKLQSNISERSKVIEKEISAYKSSEEEFTRAQDIAKEIKDEKQLKEVSDLINVSEKKYKQHDELMESYKGILKSENDLAKYLQGKTPETSQVNNLVEKYNSAVKLIQNKIDNFNVTQKQVQKEANDITKLLNNT